MKPGHLVRTMKVLKFSIIWKDLTNYDHLLPTINNTPRKEWHRQTIQYFVSFPTWLNFDCQKRPHYNGSGQDWTANPHFTVKQKKWWAGNRLALLPEGSGVEEARRSNHNPNRCSSEKPLRTSQCKAAHSSRTPKHLCLRQIPDSTSSPSESGASKVVNKRRLRTMRSMVWQSATSLKSWIWKLKPKNGFVKKWRKLEWRHWKIVDSQKGNVRFHWLKLSPFFFSRNF